MIRTHKLPLAIALALGSSAAHALGLGAIEVRSGLNEPLVAEIPLNEAFPGEAAEVKVALAKAEDFARVGLDQASLTVPLAFDLVDGGASGPRIQVTSDMPVREPFLSFLVEITWPNGRLLREYSVLLDPPGVAPAVIGTRTVVEPLREATPVETAPAPEALPESTVVPNEPAAEPVPPVEPVAAEPAAAEPAPPTEPVATPEPEPAAAVEPAPEPVAAPAPEPAPEPAPQPEPAPVAAGPTDYGPVASGETLWEIASATRPSDAVTLNQMMVAILRMNPEAFGDGNANQLKRGAVLRIPGVAEAQAIAVADAAAEIAAQNQAWQAARGTTLVADAAFGSGRSTTDDGSSDSRLELVPPRSGDGGVGGADRPGVAGGTDTALEADLKRAREQLASREQEGGELRSRVAELERIQRDNERLVTLKNSEIAELQRRLEEAEQAAAAARQTAADAEARVAAAASAQPAEPEPVTVPSPEPSPEPVALAPTPVESPLAVESPAPVESSISEPAPGVDTAAIDGGATPTPAPVEGAVEAPAETPAVAEVTPLPEPSPVSEAPPAIVDEERPPLPWWRETWALAAGGGAIVLLGLILLLTRGRKKPEPAAESRASVADSFGSNVFGAGGAAAGALAGVDDGEGALLDRLAADPTDLDAHLELLRHHYSTGDTEKFEAAAGAMYAQVTDPSAMQWQDAQAMGRALLPDHPLFADLSESDSAGVAQSSYAEHAFDLDAVESAAAAPAMAPVSGQNDFDFSLEAADAPKASDFSFDVDVAKPDESAFRTQEMARPEFDFEAPVAAPSQPVVAAPAAAPADGGFFDGEDTVGTKLDLARAYLDMGDPEGARSMLQEVITEGDDAQKAEARRLLAEIG